MKKRSKIEYNYDLESIRITFGKNSQQDDLHDTVLKYPDGYYIYIHYNIKTQNQCLYIYFTVERSDRFALATKCHVLRIQDLNDGCIFVFTFVDDLLHDAKESFLEGEQFYNMVKNTPKEIMLQTTEKMLKRDLLKVIDENKLEKKKDVGS